MLKNRISSAKLKALPAGIPTLPSGWLSGYDAVVLYSATLEVGDGGSILEVGSWVGRSSCCIAYGVRDASPLQIRYDIVDYGITGSSEWEERFGTSFFTETNISELSRVIMHPGGTVALLKQNLVDRDLARHVRLIVLGDIRDLETTRRYDFVFCDATHGEAEIRKNIPLIATLMTPDAILICDDIVNDGDAAIVSEIWGAEAYHLTAETGEYSKMGVFTRGRFTDLFI